MCTHQHPVTATPFFFTVLLSGMLILPAWSDEAQSHRERHRDAITRARATVDGQPAPSTGSLIGLGDALLRGGQCDEAAQTFERAIERSPDSEPYLWQYGIALFFVGRYDEARSLFEKHRVVNPHDVENAAWHFLCVAKADGLAKARNIVLPAPGDSRVPMEEVLQRLQGGNFESIGAAIEKTRGTPSHASAEFYGNLYVGLIADAEGNTDVSQEHLQKASETEMTNYMADVARVYASHRPTRSARSAQK